MNIKHEVETLVTDLDRLHQQVIDLGYRIIERGDWALAAQDRIKQMEERVAALERKVSPKCTCSKCTGLPDTESYYKETEAADPPAPESPSPVPSEDDWDAMNGCREYANESTFTSLPSDMFCRLYDHSRHCAKHHTLSAEDRGDVNFLLKTLCNDEAMYQRHIHAIKCIQCLLPTIPEEQS